MWDDIATSINTEKLNVSRFSFFNLYTFLRYVNPNFHGNISAESLARTRGLDKGDTQITGVCVIGS